MNFLMSLLKSFPAWNYLEWSLLFATENVVSLIFWIYYIKINLWLYLLKMYFLFLGMDFWCVERASWFYCRKIYSQLVYKQRRLSKSSDLNQLFYLIITLSISTIVGLISVKLCKAKIINAFCVKRNQEQLAIVFLVL